MHHPSWMASVAGDQTLFKGPVWTATDGDDGFGRDRCGASFALRLVTTMLYDHTFEPRFRGFAITVVRLLLLLEAIRDPECRKPTPSLR
jgi:hypothetical protein